MIRSTFNAMGTTVAVHTTDGDIGPVESLFEQNEQRFSRFRSDSELSRLNERRDTIIDVSQDLADLLDRASNARRRTQGLVDVGVGRALTAWGYDRTFSAVTDSVTAPKPTGPPSWDINGRKVRRSRATAFDLGGIAKGWTCDRAVESHLAVIVSAGGDLRSSDPSLLVDVLDASGRVAAEVPVGVGALATSSTSRRAWQVAGSPVNHIIDPRTMKPVVSPIVSATVVTDTAVDAEAGAKAVLLMGVDGLAWAAQQRWIRNAVAIWHDGSVFGTTVKGAA